jgi:hypothetical protein
MISKRIRKSLMSQTSGLFDWTRAVVVVGCVAALLAVCVFVAAPQTVSLGAARAAHGKGLHKLAAAKGATTPTPTTTAPAQSADAASGTSTEPPPPAGAVSPPSTLDPTCTTDVSKPINSWLNHLPENSFVYIPSNACYLINEGINLWKPLGLTIEGGTFEMTTYGALTRMGINVIGGNHVTLEYLAVVGSATKQVYNKDVEFQAGVELQGTMNATVTHVKVFDVRGDGFELVPLRAFEVGNSGGGGTIVRPVENLVVNGLYVNGAGRMGVSLASVRGAQLSNIQIRNVAFDDFDFEADQSTEGAENVTINNCTVGGKGFLFLSNQGYSAGQYTGNITVENCQEINPQGGVSVLVEDIPVGKTQRGPFTFINDKLQCGDSRETSCVVLKRANVTFDNSSLTFGWNPYEPVYNASMVSDVTFNNDTVTGYKYKGILTEASKAIINGGTWTIEPPTKY